MRDENDTTRVCLDCGEDFTLTQGERIFFDAKGLQYPKRCRECRMARKAERAEPVRTSYWR